MTQDNETPYEALTRIKKMATRVYSNMTAQGDPRIAGIKNTTTYLGGQIGELAFAIQEMSGFLAELVEPTVVVPSASEQPTREQLHQLALEVREEAALRFSDRLRWWPSTLRYHTRDTGEPVVFTPHGWRVESEVIDSVDYDIYVR